MTEIAPSNIPIPDPSLLTIAALDKAIQGLHALLQQIIGANKELVTQALSDLEKRFQERDRRFDESQGSMRLTLDSNSKTCQQALDDLKTRVGAIELRAAERVTAIESRQRGIGESWAVVVAVVSSVAAASSIIFAFFNHVR